MVLRVLGVAAFAMTAFTWGLAAPAEDHARARERMVRIQLAGRDITDAGVLAAMGKVERHRFVPAAEQAAAYDDRPLPIGDGQTISQPYVVATMTQAVRPRKGMKVLEIGTGSGYQAAVLAELVGQVYTIEIVPALGKRAEMLLTTLGYANVHVRVGDGFKGWPEEAPFDAIVVTAAPSEIPPPLLAQLAVGGRLVIPVGETWQELVLVEKKDGGKLERTTLYPVRFVPMTGEAQRER